MLYVIDRYLKMVMDAHYGAPNGPTKSKQENIVSTTDPYAISDLSSTTDKIIRRANSWILNAA